ncbi:ABC transporter substrate-binding protein [Salinispira pacifica]|uniref:Multiple sugar ABC transporter, substrate-binding protein n=1 Tax=Salinispira pacifica TaxID=1307761 RepID=V5WJY0_9SPIO|nr:extracellular solute-binding protein [Salinispira pacifica]AHC16107.1 Multiple sugar ABC transporter, substrate-binding protein [Salinispira pacifica]
MVRRMVIIMACLVLLAPLGLAANGQDEAADDGPRKLVINSNLSDPAPKAAFEDLVNRFREEYPDIEVTLNSFDHEAYKTAIRNFLASNPPDVALWFAGNRMKFFVDQGLIMDISDLWEEAGFNDSMASSRPTLTVDGKQYGVPWGYYQWGMFYRTDIFEEYGIDVPETWDEFMEAGDTLVENGITPVTIGTKFLWTAAGWFDYLNLRINGYDYHMDLTAGDASYLDPELDRVFEVWEDMIDRGFFLENHATYSWQEAQAPFINGNAAMYLIGNFITPDLESAGVIDNVGFFQFPQINPEVGMYEDAPMEAYLVPAGAENVEEAKLFLEFASRADVLADFAYEVGNIPPNKNSRPPEDRFTLAGFEMLNQADGLAQFYDRDTDPEMASVGMEGFQEFMVNPDRLPEIRARLDEERKNIFQ